MKQEVLIGQTDYSVLVLIRDAAGAPATGLDETDIDIAYTRVETDNDVVCTGVTPAALANLTATHTDWGFEEVSATDAPGLYRVDIADAVFASAAWSAVVSIVGAGLDPCQVEFVLVAHNPQTAISEILTDTGTTLQGELDGIQADTEDIQSRLPTALVGGRIDATVDATGMESGAVAAIADGVWDEAESGHASSGTFGQRLQPIRTGTAQAGGASTITLDSGANSTNPDFYNGNLIHLTGGTGAGQARAITDYDQSTKVATVDSAWIQTPDNTSVFQILPGGAATLDGPVDANVTEWNGSAVATPTVTGVPKVDVTHVSGNSTAADNLEAAYDGTAYKDIDNAFVSRVGTAQAGASGTIKLDPGASSTDDFYNNQVIQIISGTGAGQARIVSDYIGSSQIASVNSNWATNPDNTSVFALFPWQG